MADSGDYRQVLGTVEGLRRGFTTGTTAQAASLAAARFLLEGRPPVNVEVTLRDGRKLLIPVVNPESGMEDGASESLTSPLKWTECGVIKDAGDDQDITNGVEIRARVRFRKEPGVGILGGRGVGRVTRPGLPAKVGEAAINPNPRRRITAELEALLADWSEYICESASGDPDKQNPGLEVTISVPEGEELARKTWNPRLGIAGGISIIGTSGIVEPKSSSAYKASIALAVKVLHASGTDTAALAFGYVGENWYRDNLGWGEDKVVKTGDHIGFAMDAAAGRGFRKLMVVGHVGKMAKMAAGLFDTHWTAGDARLETVAAWAAAAGGSPADAAAILDLKTAEAAVSYLRERGLEKAWGMMNRRLLERCRLRFEKDGKEVPAMVSILLDLEGRELAHDEI